jgi:hypothetical protein
VAWRNREAVAAIQALLIQQDDWIASLHANERFRVTLAMTVA